MRRTDRRKAAGLLGVYVETIVRDLDPWQQALDRFELGPRSASFEPGRPSGHSDPASSWLGDPIEEHRRRVDQALQLLERTARVLSMEMADLLSAARIQDEHTNRQWSCQVCGDTAQGSRSRNGRCTSCALFRQKFHRDPTPGELASRRGDRWQVRTPYGATR